jgi:CP family cyanate transporter-like MFS transporter
VLAALVAFAFNLRPGLVSVGPLLLALQASLALSSTAVGVLTALPVLAFGAGTAFAERVGRRLGWGNGIVVAAALIAGGIALRSAGSAAAAYAGAALLGLGVGLGSVYVPALMKAYAGHRLGTAMGVYTLMLVGGSMLSVAAAPALFHAFGDDWRPALGVWALPAAFAALAWLPLRGIASPAPAGHARARLWNNPLAWAVSINMAMQSTLFYSLASWMGALLAGRGLSLDAVGLTLSVFFLAQFPSSLFAPMLFARSRRQGLASVGLAVLAAVSLVLMLYGPTPTIALSCAILGFSLGGFFALALSYLVWRSHTPDTAAALSGMAQTVGYLTASAGPLLLGVLRGAPDPRLASTLWMLFLLAGAMAAGALAGRPAFVDEAPAPSSTEFPKRRDSTP